MPTTDSLAGTTRADDYAADLARIYDGPGSKEALIKRLASWLGNADQSVLLFLVLAELRTLNARLAAEPIHTRVKRPERP